MLHDASVGKVDIFFGLTVGMDTTNAILIFGTVANPLGRTLANRLYKRECVKYGQYVPLCISTYLMVIIILFAAPRSSALLANTNLLFLVIVDRYNFGPGILVKGTWPMSSLDLIAVCLHFSRNDSCLLTFLKSDS